MSMSSDKSPVLRATTTTLPPLHSCESLTTHIQHRRAISTSNVETEIFSPDPHFNRPNSHLAMLPNGDKSTLFSSLPPATETSALLRSPSLDLSASPGLPSPVLTGNNHPLRQSHTIAASTSFFAIPLSMSTLNLRESLALPAPVEGEIDWVSLYVVYIVTLVAEAARGLVLPSTWPYYASLGGTKSTIGSFVASFSLGRMISTIPLGYLSDNASVGLVLMISSVIQVFGHLIYGVAPSLSVLYISRIIVGFGSATMSVCRAHLTRAIPANLRTHHFAYLSALQFIGFAVLPGLGGILALLPELKPFSFLQFNGFTYPAFVLVIANIIAIFLVHEFYIDPPQVQPRSLSRASSRPPSRVPSSQRVNEVVSRHGVSQSVDNGILSHLTRDSANGQTGDRVTYEFQLPEVALSTDTVALITCLLVNVAFRGVIAELETVSVPFLMEQYGLDYGTSSFYLSVIGFAGLVVYVSFKPIAERFSDRLLVVTGLVFVLASALPLSIPWLSSHMYVVVYVLFLGLTWSIAYPVGQTAVLALFSKILAGLPAGGFLGIFSASGSIARLVMAVFAGKMWNDFGRESVFFGILVYTLATLLLTTWFYKRLVPNPRYMNR